MNQPPSQTADKASSPHTHIPRSKQQQCGDDEWTDGRMDESGPEPPCLQQSGGTQMSCLGNVWTTCKTKGCAGHAVGKVLSV